MTRSKSKTPTRSDVESASWVRHFWGVLIFLSLAAAILVYFSLNGREKESEDAYISFQVSQIVGDGLPLVGRIDLVTSARNAVNIRQREEKIRQIISRTLTKIFAGDARPTLGEVSKAILGAVNADLPPKLHIREVLILELLRGRP